MPIDQETFDRYWNKTEIIRSYEPMLFTFTDTDLPYIIAGEHHLKDRVVVIKGVVKVQEPSIIVARNGPQFLKGFENAGALSCSAVYIFRNMNLPYCNVTNSVIRRQEIEYGGLQAILHEYDEKLKAKDNKIMGLITGIVEGADVSLMRYVAELAVKSKESNVRQIINHLKIRGGGKAHPDDLLNNIKWPFN